jgi:hypothetical protein
VVSVWSSRHGVRYNVKHSRLTKERESVDHESSDSFFFAEN